MVLLTQEQLEQIIEGVMKRMLPNLNPVQKTDRLMTREEAAKYLDISKPTLLEWERKGYIEGTRLGNRVYYKESGLLNRSGDALG